MGIPLTGTSVNPARSLGPALVVGGTALSQVWLFIVAPLVGGVLAAGLHRLLDRAETIREARVVIVAAGMEGALPSVVAGLVAAPVIAVPTSIGYGASFHGLAALLAMLNSCASGVGVVNIDNGFGAGHLACQILKSADPS